MIFNTIAKGGGGGNGWTTNGIATNAEPNGSILITESSVTQCAFTYKPITAVESQTATIIYAQAFNGCANLQTALFPSVTELNGGEHFRSCTSLSRIYFPNLTKITSSYTFSGDNALHVGVFPKLTSINQSIRNSGFHTLDFGSNVSIGNYWFTGSSSLSTLILRSNTLCALTNTGGLGQTPFASGGTGGTLYVPSALISQYQSANNWSTILGYANNQIKSIESTHTDPTAPIDLTLYYADGTPIS